jgi:nucleoside-diphosphate-sugar epimerase
MNKLKILITGGNGNIAKIIKNNLFSDYNIFSPFHGELDLLDQNNLKDYIYKINPDIVIHTAIVGGRRTQKDDYDVFYKNILMFENLLYCCKNIKMIINLDSGAIYDRNTNIINRKETDIFTVPIDFYGFSKYTIYKQSLLYDNVYNFRIFNLFHANEENDRFIKACFNAKKNNLELLINDDKYFDFFYEDDFIKVLKYYLDNFNKNNLEKNNLEKTINICYKQKYKLSEIANLIESIGEYKKINIKIINASSNHNYCGDSTLLYNLKKDKFELNGLEKSLEHYFLLKC